MDVREVVAGVGVARILRQRALGQPPRFLEPIDLVIREGQRGLEPPVVAVRRGERLEEGHPLLLAIARAREADRAAGLVDEHRVAWELRDVLVDEVEAACRLAADQRAERLDVLPLTTRGARHDLARLVDCRARRGRIAMSDGHEGDARVRQRETLVRLHRRRERIVGTGAVR